LVELTGIAAWQLDAACAAVLGDWELKQAQLATAQLGHR
jgi:hypothetical protein